MDTVWSTFTARTGTRFYALDPSGNITVCFSADYVGGNLYVFTSIIPMSTADPWFATATMISGQAVS